LLRDSIENALRRARSFKKLKKKGQAGRDRPGMRSVILIYSDSQDWRLREGAIEVRTHRGWNRIAYRNNKQLHRYLYNNWKPSSELKLKLTDGKILVYLTLAREFEVYYSPDNAVTVYINENNITLAVFVGRKLHEIYRIETSIGMIVIAYSERRRRITEGRSTRDREARKSLKSLERGRGREMLSIKQLGLLRRSPKNTIQP
jgi:transposase